MNLTQAIIGNNNKNTYANKYNKMYEQCMPTVHSVDSEYSYFSEAIDQILDMKSKYADLVLNLAEAAGSIDESDASVIFRTFSREVKNLFTNFMGYYDSSVGGLVSAIEKASREDEITLKPYKDKLANYPYEFSLPYPKGSRYKFTHIDKPGMPNPHAIVDYTSEFKEVKKVFSRLDIANNRVEEMDEIYKELNNELHSGDFYNQIRGKILCTDSIEVDQFATAIFNVFRDGGVELIDPIRGSEISETYKRFTSYKDIAISAKKERRNVKSEYEEVIKRIDTIDLSQYVHHTYQTDGYQFVLDRYNSYIKLKIEELMNIMSFHLLAFNGKLDAIKDSYAQDRVVISAAIAVINRKEG